MSSGKTSTEPKKAFKEAERQTSKFGRRSIAASDEQRSTVIAIVTEYGLKTKVATLVLFDVIVDAGKESTMNFAKEATEKLHGSPFTGISERTWLLALFLEHSQQRRGVARILRDYPVDEQRLTNLRMQIEALPE